MTIHLPQGDLARCITHEPDSQWPEKIEVRAIFATAKGGKKYKSIEISGDQFFGRGQYGAPMSGDVLIAMVDRLRKAT